MTEKTKYFIDKETLEKEEQEAKEKGITIFQLRHNKKIAENRKRGHEEYCKKLRKEKEKRLKREKEKKLRKRERERAKAIKLKEEKKEKERIKKQKKKEREAEKKRLYLEAHPPKPVKKKRPIGRPKKVGRKINYYKRRKKKKELELKRSLPKKYNSFNYKVVSCRNGNQNEFICYCENVSTAYEKVNELLRESKEVIFPSRISISNKMTDTKYEYLILERKTDSEKINLLRNEYGKIVEQKTNSLNWGVYDKFKYDVEETFWVWGYNNRKDRKTFQWIYENILLGKIYSEYDLRFVCLYKNKIIFKDDNDELDIVFCKSVTDAGRFYSLLEEYVKKDKIKQVFFLGSFNVISEKRKKLEDKLIEMTGWTKKKIQMTSTSEYIK